LCSDGLGHYFISSLHLPSHPSPSFFRFCFGALPLMILFWSFTGAFVFLANVKDMACSPFPPHPLTPSLFYVAASPIPFSVYWFRRSLAFALFFLGWYECFCYPFPPNAGVLLMAFPPPFSFSFSCLIFLAFFEAVIRTDPPTPNFPGCRPHTRTTSLFHCIPFSLSSVIFFSRFAFLSCFS